MLLNTAALALVIILAHRGNNVRHQKKWTMTKWFLIHGDTCNAASTSMTLFVLSLVICMLEWMSIVTHHTLFYLLFTSSHDGLHSLPLPNLHSTNLKYLQYRCKTTQSKKHTNIGGSKQPIPIPLPIFLRNHLRMPSTPRGWSRMEGPLRWFRRRYYSRSGPGWDTRWSDTRGHKQVWIACRCTRH